MDPLVAAVAALAVAALLACSAFFSSSETAIFSLSREWVATAAETDARGRTLAALLDDPHRLLVTLLVGNNVVNVAISSIVTVLVTSYLPPGPAVVAATFVTSVLVLVGGEIVPKSIGLANATQWSLTVARPVRLVERALSPVIDVFDWVTRHISALVPAEEGIEKPYMD